MYKTNSLFLASFLHCAGEVKFQGTETQGENNEKMFFLFEPEEKASKIATDFFNSKTTADPFALFQSYRALKDMIFENQRNRK